MDFKQLLHIHYGIYPQHFHLVQDIDDAIYLIEDEQGKKFKMRIFREVSSEELAALKAIADWINFLNKNLEVPFPNLIPSLQGSYFIENANRFIVMYTWLDWEILPQFNPKNIRKLGLLMAQIHEASSQYGIKPKSSKRLDSDWINQFFENNEEALIASFELSAIQLNSLHDKLKRLSSFLLSESQVETNVGFIHSDVHRMNIVRHQTGALSLIDFDDALLAPFALDIGILFNEFVDYPEQFEHWKKHFLEAYSSVRKIDVSSLNYHQKIGDLMYLDWLCQMKVDKGSLSEKQAKYGRIAIESILAFQP